MVNLLIVGISHQIFGTVITQAEDFTFFKKRRQYFLGQTRFKLLQVISKYVKLVSQAQTLLYLHASSTMERVTKI